MMEKHMIDMWLKRLAIHAPSTPASFFLEMARLDQMG